MMLLMEERISGGCGSGGARREDGQLTYGHVWGRTKTINNYYLSVIHITSFDPIYSSQELYELGISPV